MISKQHQPSNDMYHDFMTYLPLKIILQVAVILTQKKN